MTIHARIVEDDGMVQAIDPDGGGKRDPDYQQKKRAAPRKARPNL